MKNEEKIQLKKMMQLDIPIRKKAAKFILHIKEVFEVSANKRNLHHLRHSKEGDVLCHIIYSDKQNEIIHSYHEECENIVEAIHFIYSRCEPLFVHMENDNSKYFYELFDNIPDRKRLFDIKNIAFGLEFKKHYKIK